MKSKKIIILAAIPVILLVFLIGGWIFLKSILNEEFLVRQLESSMNMRAEIKRLNISLFSIVSSVELEGVALGKRDVYANRGVELTKRPAFRDPEIAVEKIDLKFSLIPLLKRRFELDRFVLQKPKINLVLLKNGDNNLAPLFGAPRIVDGKPNPDLNNRRNAKAGRKKRSGPNEPFDVRSLPIAAGLNEIGLKDARLNIKIAKTGQLIRIAPLTLTVSDIDIDPANLKKHNRAEVKFDTDIVVIGKKGNESARLILRSGGEVTPFNHRNGRVNPAVVYAVSLKKKTFISGMELMKQLAGALPLLEKAGLNLDHVGGKAVLEENVSAKIRYGRGRVTLLGDISCPTANYTLELNKKSWLRLTDNHHLFQGRIIASKAESNRAIRKVDRAIKKSMKKAKGVSVQKLREILLAGMLVDGRIQIGFRSSGDITDPQITLAVAPPSLTELVKKGAAEILKGGVKTGVDKAIQKKLPGKTGRAAKKALDKLFR